MKGQRCVLKNKCCADDKLSPAGTPDRLKKKFGSSRLNRYSICDKNKLAEVMNVLLIHLLEIWSDITWYTLSGKSLLFRFGIGYFPRLALIRAEKHL